MILAQLTGRHCRPHRWSTCSCVLDYNTVAAGDKFGNVAVVRLPADITDEVEEDPTGTKAIWDRGLLSGASQKVGTELLS